MGCMSKESFKTGGSFLDNVTAPIISARWALCKYGTMKDAAPMLVLKYDLALEKPWEESLSLGLHADDCTISKDGKILTLKPNKGINSESKGGLWLTSLQDCKDPEFPADLLGDDASVFDGMKVLLIQEKPPEFYTDKSRTVTVVSRIIELPPAAKKAAGKSASGKASSGKAAPAGGDVAAKATAFIVGLIAKNGEITQNEIIPAIFRDMGTDLDAAAMSQLAYNAEFLGAGPWMFDAATGKLSSK